jgi:hypothetical protein
LALLAFRDDQDEYKRPANDRVAREGECWLEAAKGAPGLITHGTRVNKQTRSQTAKEPAQLKTKAAAFQPAIQKLNKPILRIVD